MRTYLFTIVVSLFFISCGMEEIPTYKIELIVSPSEGGKLNVSPSLPMYPEGSTVTITSEPNENWVFKQWEGDGSGSSSPLQITMTANKSIVGVFVRNQTITSLNCDAATNNGTLNSGVAATGVVNIIIPYTGAFGGIHNGQTVTSTGVTGLTATLAAGTFANGSGNLTYTIAGIPSAVGTASFAINIGGKTCGINRTVLAPGEVMSMTGRIWMDKNLGASRVATSITDADSYGDLYQWGRSTDGHQKRTSATTATLSSTDQPVDGKFITNSGNGDWRGTPNDNLWQGVNGINNPCPSGYRLPTITELKAEMESWVTKDAQGAFSSPLKWTMAGYRYYMDGRFVYTGNEAWYWSSTVRNGFNEFSVADYLRFFTNHASIQTSQRANALSVRCIKN